MFTGEMRRAILITLALFFMTGFSASGAPRDTAIVNNLVRKGFKYLSARPVVNITRARECIDSAMIICRRKDIDPSSGLMLLRAEYFIASGDFRKAEEQGQELLKTAENTGDYAGLARGMLFMGKYNLRTGLYSEGIEYFKQAIKIAQDKNLRSVVPKAYEGIANIYFALNNTGEYRKSYQAMADAAIAEKDSLSLALAISRLGTSLTSKPRDFIKADSLLRKGLALSQAIKDTFWITFSLANIGWNFYSEKKYDSSIVYYNKSLKYSVPGKQYTVSANSFGNLGTIYRDLGNYDKALDYYRNSIEEADKIDDYYSLSWVYMDMSDMYLMRGDTGSAFRNFLLYNQFSDSLQMQKNSQGLMSAKIRYEADSHNKEVELLSLRIKNQRILNYAIIGFFVLSLAIMILIFSRTRIKSRQRISEMNRKISEVTQANLRQQMNPHFIFNTLNSIQYYMYQHDKLATNNYLTKFSSLMRKVLENSQHTSVRLQDELDALKLYLELESLRFSNKFDYEINVDDDIDTLVFKVPTMLIQPYVENSISHGLMPKEEKGIVRVDLRLEDKHIICTIEDNGIGRQAAEERKKLRNENHNSFGTQITSSRLDLVNSLYGISLKTSYTDLVNGNGEPSGTKVVLHIPILT